MQHVVNKWSTNGPLSSHQTFIFFLVHELLPNEAQIPGKQELNQTNYLGPIPLLHFTFLLSL